MASVVVAAERQRLDRIEAERERQEEIQRERENRAIEIQNDAHDVLKEDMEQRLKDWRYGRDVEAFAAAVRERAIGDACRIEPDSLIGRWLDWAASVIAHYDGEALGDQSHLRTHSYTHGYKLGSRFDWDHKLTTNDALVTFLRPTEEIVRELEAEDRAAGRE